VRAWGGGDFGVGRHGRGEDSVASKRGIRARRPSLERKLQVPSATAGGGPRPGGRGWDGDRPARGWALGAPRSRSGSDRA